MRTFKGYWCHAAIEPLQFNAFYIGTGIGGRELTEGYVALFIYHLVKLRMSHTVQAGEQGDCGGECYACFCHCFAVLLVLEAIMA